LTFALNHDTIVTGRGNCL